MPSIAKVLFGIGDELLSFIPNSGQPPQLEVQHRQFILNHAGQKVPTEFFLEPRTGFISGIIYAATFLTDSCSAADSLCVIHRPAPVVPLPLGTVPSKCEMWQDDQGMLVHRGRCARHGVYSQ
jgi:hypothetical protein